VFFQTELAVDKKQSEGDGPHENPDQRIVGAVSLLHEYGLPVDHVMGQPSVVCKAALMLM
jgi:hypothetical protein